MLFSFSQRKKKQNKSCCCDYFHSMSLVINLSIIAIQNKMGSAIDQLFDQTFEVSISNSIEIIKIIIIIITLVLVKKMY